ncbi:MAG: 16S rRNA (cytidine(1402)-2'-O)-methyltransferase [Desulfobacteraceae bacterium]|nr:16S rRNA (cytidine(1402)-2'-O)-methyltransferase [Desulfobacteraceae bacterium]
MNLPRGKSLPGILYVVATPIGNLEDITYRAVNVLGSVDIVAAEDTRHTARLLSRYNIKTRLISCHEHNEAERADMLVKKILAGSRVALVSDAGTPSVSDPGYRLVLAALEAGLSIVPVPGPSAPIAALSVSGLPSDRFCFAGFLPKKKAKRGELLNSLAGSEQTLIFYESPRRLAGLLKILFDYLGDRRAMIAREMTKQHEEYIRGPLSELAEEIEQRQSVKGEVTVLVSGKTPLNGDAEKLPPALEEEIKAAVSGGDVPTSRLAADLAQKYGTSKNKIYQLILEFKKGD